MKKISLFVLLSVLCVSTNVQTGVNAQSGEGVWPVLTRIGNTMDVVDSKVCDILDSDPCVFLIRPADIATGTYIISTPGYYCLTGDATVAGSPAIQINSENVTIDLNGQNIMGDGTNDLINLTSMSEETIIKNGTLSCADDAINGNAKRLICKDVNFIGGGAAGNTRINLNDSAQGLECIDCRFVNTGGVIVPSAPMSRIVRSVADDDNLHFFKNCIFTGAESTQISMVVPTFIMHNCVMDFNSSVLGILVSADRCDMRDCYINGGALNLGGGTVYCFNCVIENVVSIANSITSDGVFDIGSTDNIRLENCIVRQITGLNGFDIDRDAHSILKNCVAESITAGNGNGAGFLITSINISNFTHVFEECRAIQCDLSGFSLGYDGSALLPAQSDHVSFIDCYAAENGLDGFEVSDGGGTFPSVIEEFGPLFDRCTAEFNNRNGFGLNNLTELNTSMKDIVLRDCIAKSNLGDGFAFANNVGSRPMNTSLLKNCISEGNGGNGFRFGVDTSDFNIFDCCSLNNTGTGFASDGTDNIFMANTSCVNGTDYSGVPLDKIVSYATTGAVKGVGRWTNISS